MALVVRCNHCMTEMGLVAVEIHIGPDRLYADLCVECVRALRVMLSAIHVGEPEIEVFSWRDALKQIMEVR